MSKVLNLLLFEDIVLLLPDHHYCLQSCPTDFCFHCYFKCVVIFSFFAELCLAILRLVGEG